jgi:hypothetical protein
MKPKFLRCVEKEFKTEQPESAVYDPLGIDPADPMIQFRNKAYPISYDRRHAGETNK